MYSGDGKRVLFLGGGVKKRIESFFSHFYHCFFTVGGTSTCFGQFSYLCPKKPEGVRRSSDLYCPIRENYELAQKNETECFQVLNMASLPLGNLQAIRLLPDVLWHYQREFWLYLCVTVEWWLNIVYWSLIGYIFRLFFIHLAGAQHWIANHFD